jgi:hypothetical protein
MKYFYLYILTFWIYGDTFLLALPNENEEISLVECGLGAIIPPLTQDDLEKPDGV